MTSAAAVRRSIHCHAAGSLTAATVIMIKDANSVTRSAYANVILMSVKNAAVVMMHCLAAGGLPASTFLMNLANSVTISAHA